MLRNIMLRVRNKRGQSTLEYAILVVIVIGALLSIQVYVKRGLQGRMKDSADNIGSQYSPDNTEYSKTVTTNSISGDTNVGGVVTRTIEQDESRTTTNSSIIDTQSESWDSGGGGSGTGGSTNSTNP